MAKKIPLADYPLKCILIIDDDKISSMLSHRVISEMNISESVVSINDVFEALIFLDTNTPDLILIDMLMPGMDGIELIAYLLKKSEKNKKKIAVISALFNSTVLQELQDIGITNFLTKPIYEKQIMDIFEKILN